MLTYKLSAPNRSPSRNNRGGCHGSDIGYTGHPQLDNLGLVGMGARIYDPTIGRFLSADPTVQNPQRLDSLNRYAYVWNNPLTLTDPNGYGFFSGVWHWVTHHVLQLAAIAVAALAAVLGQFEIDAGMSGLFVAATSAAGGFAAGLIASGGNVTYGLIGAATALAFYGIGNYFHGSALFDRSTDLPTEAGVEDTVTHGAVGGFASLAEGGSFGSGFLSAAVPQAATPYVGTALSYTHLQNGLAANTVAASVLGGTASELGGGKFANGAVTGAFGYLFNDAVHLIDHGGSKAISRSGPVQQPGVP